LNRVKTRIAVNRKPIPLSVPQISGNEWKYVKECLDTGWVSSVGSYVNRFENELARYTGAKYAVATLNGTSALHTSLMLSDIDEGDEVIVPTVTFIAPVNAVKYIGATPVFIDCDNYLNIDINKLIDFFKNECYYNKGRLINKETKSAIKAIIPVHVFGNPVNIEPIIDLASKYNLMVIEDAAEAIGSYYRSGKYMNKKTGTIGDFGCYSFNGNKIITTGGGGMIVTDNPKYAAKAKYLTNQAKDDPLRYIHDEIGYNYRMTNVLAAIGCAQLEQIDRYIEIKRQNFLAYKEAISTIEGLSLIDESEYGFSNFWHYSLLVDKKRYGTSRDLLMDRLSGKNIQSRPLWMPNHLQLKYKSCQAYAIEKAGYYYENILNIPCSTSLSAGEVERVIEVLKNGCS